MADLRDSKKEFAKSVNRVVFFVLSNDDASQLIACNIYESIAVQQLCLKGITPRYHKYELRDEKENKAKTYELDLVAERGFSVTANEVKISKNYTTSSLDKIKKKYPQLKVKRMVFGIKNLKFESDIITLPLYMIPFL